jgi:hypothetical protein
MRYPRHRPILSRATCIALAILASPVHAAEPRITSATPTASGWQVTVQGIASPEFQLGGQAATARRSTDGQAEGDSWEILPANAGDASRLVIKERGRDVLALRLQPDSPTEAPFDDWSI